MPSSALLRPPLRVTAMGEERCRCGHAYGPAVRDYYLLHVVVQGCGVLTNARGTFAVGAGQGFLISPGETTVYRADGQTPWHYLWAGFAGDGLDAAFAALGLGPDAPVVALGAEKEAAQEVIRSLCRDAARLRAGELAAAGGVYRLLALLGECAREGLPGLTQAQRHYRRALWLLESSPAGETPGVAALARGVGLSRSQLYRVFEEVCGQTPQAVLIQRRLRQAVRLLEQTDLPLEAVAAAAGYSSAARLCDAFRAARMGRPGDYRASSRGEKS